MECCTKKVKILDRKFRITGYPEDAYHNQFLKTGMFSEGIVDLLRSLVGSDFTCLDVGANLGLVTLTLSHLAPDGHIYSFEPTPDVYALLETNLRDNNISNVTGCNLAIGNKCGDVKLKTIGQYSAANFVVPEHLDLHEFVQFQNPIAIPMTTLDRWAEEQDLEKIDLVKIDVEGFEIQVLDGARQMLARYEPMVLLEFNSYTLIRFQDISPRRLLEKIFEIFDLVCVLDRKLGGTLVQLENKEVSRETFLEINLTEGFVDNLLCAYPKHMNIIPVRQQLDESSMQPELVEVFPVLIQNGRLCRMHEPSDNTWMLVGLRTGAVRWGVITDGATFRRVVAQHGDYSLAFPHYLEPALPIDRESIMSAIKAHLEGTSDDGVDIKTCDSALFRDQQQRCRTRLFVRRFYVECLGREADEPGLTYWTDGLIDGSLTGSQLVYSFMASQEFLNRDITDDEYVSTCYAAFFGHAADRDGYDGWMAALAGGEARLNVLARFTKDLKFDSLCDAYGIQPR